MDLNNEVQILTSTVFAERLVHKLKLLEDPEFNAAIRPPKEDILGLAWAKTWIKATIRDLGIAGEGELQELPPTAADQLRDTIRVLQGVISVEVIRLSKVIAISVEVSDPQKAARLANAIADEYVVDQLEARFEATAKANNWLNERLTELRETVQAAERAASAFATEQGIFETGGNGEATIDKRLSEINTQLLTARADLAQREARVRTMRDKLARGRGSEAFGEVADSSAIQALRDKRAELARKRSELLSRYGERHPDVLKVNDEIAATDSQINAEIRRQAAILENELQVASARVQVLEAELKAIEDEASRTNLARVKLRELRMTAESSRKLYETFLNRFNETGQQSDLEAPKARVISRAISVNIPSSPKTALNVAIGIVLGTLVAVGIAVLRDLLDRGIRTRQQFEEQFGIGVLSAIPANGPVPHRARRRRFGRRDPTLSVIDKPMSAFAEAIRTLRSAVAIANVDKPIKTLLVTSSLPNEGKTTTAIAIARSAAQGGARVLFIDADMRRPCGGAILLGREEQVAVGFVDYLAGNTELEATLHKDTKSEVDVIVPGYRATNPSDLIASAAFKRFLNEWAATTYDLVVIDSSPLLPVVDPRALSTICDATIFVTRWNKTPRDAIRAGLNYLGEYHANLSGAILTMVDLKQMARYGYGDTYYYYRQYSNYYTEK
ncbi:exopolysaccharide transport family protein [Zavarzinia compransoris]|nr:exopolysaccharide transport family protein [Zavarzinia compransoris]